LFVGQTHSILFPFLEVLPGICARVLFADEIAADPNVVFPKLITLILPHGLLGIVVASMLASVMSGLAAVFNSCSTIFTIDYYQQLRPSATQREVVLVGRLAAVVITVFGVLWIPVIPLFGKHLWLYLQSVQVGWCWN
jgi:SSS family solute:Na+ symporter